MGLTFESDISVTQEGMGWALWQKIAKKETIPWILFPIVEGGRNQLHSLELQFLAVYR